jgi:hypothetical protein
VTLYGNADEHGAKASIRQMKMSALLALDAGHRAIGNYDGAHGLARLH